MATVDPRRYNLFFTDKAKQLLLGSGFICTLHSKLPFYFAYSFLNQKSGGGDSAGQYCLGASHGSAVRCWLGCRYRGPLLAWMSSLAYSHCCQSVLSAGVPMVRLTPVPTCDLPSMAVSGLSDFFPSFPPERES